MKRIKILLTGWAVCVLGLPVYSQTSFTESSQTQKKDIAMQGDRNPNINQKFPEQAFYHRNPNGNVLDVTKPPFNAKGDGITDDTAALNAAMRFVREHYEVTKKDGKIYCSQRMNRNWIIYFPDGKYLVSDTICQGWPASAMNILKGWSQVEYLTVDSSAHEAELCGKERPELHGNLLLLAANDNHDCYIRGQYNSSKVYAEINWSIRLIGQSRQKTIIRLKDSSPGFADTTGKPVVSFYMLQRGSNINLGNFFENITIDIGRGNSSSIGLQWNSSNWGGIRNTAIRSASGEGRCGLLMECNNATGYFRDLSISGFDIGIKLSAGRESIVTLEFATLTGQRDTAIVVGNAKSGGGGDSLSARQLVITNVPRALSVERAGQVVLLESKIALSGILHSAVEIGHDGFLLARDIDISGDSATVRKEGKVTLKTNHITEYFSARPIGKSPASLRLPIEESPMILPDSNFENWACVEAFGALGDGRTDDTAAIQRAMNSGKPVVVFTSANYVINGTVDIPASVREITFILAVIQRSKTGLFDGPGLFRVAEAASEPLLIHRAITAGGVFLDHTASRPVVLEDIFVLFNHVRDMVARDGMLFVSAVPQNTEIWRLYRNTTPEGPRKRLFVNNCIGFAGDNKNGSLAVENAMIWGRMMNTEHLPGALYAFKRSDAWILGLKSENADTLLSAKDHSKVEVLGGSFLNFASKQGPVVVSENSQLNAMFYLWHWAIAPATIGVIDENGKKAIYPLDVFSPCDTVDGGVIFIQ